MKDTGNTRKYTKKLKGETRRGMWQVTEELQINKYAKPMTEMKQYGREVKFVIYMKRKTNIKKLNKNKVLQESN